MNDSPAPIPTFGALILAGGQSSRMGTDKASLPYRGVTLLSHMRGLAAQAGATQILTGGGPSADLQDPVSGAGPVGSLCALAAARIVPERWIVLPVDMPLLEPALLRTLAGAPFPAAAFKDHPLPLALTMDAAARAVFAQVKAKLTNDESVAVWQVREWLKGRELPPADTDMPQLINVNTPDEWSRLNDRT